MSARLQRHLLYRLHQTARLSAVEDAIERGLLATAGHDASCDDDEHVRRIVRPVAEDYDRRFDSPFSSAQTEERHGNVVLGSLLRGRSREASVRILARQGIMLSDGIVPARCAMDAGSSATLERNRHNPSVAEVWHAVRWHAPPPQADDIAVMLLLVAAIDQGRISNEHWRRVLRRHDWITTILSPVDGFELRLMHMLREGAFGHPIGICQGDDLRSDMVSLPARFEQGRSLIVFRGKEQDGCAAAEREERVGFAARLGVPMLGIADEPDHLPRRLREVASLSLGTGPLTSAIISTVIGEVLGKVPAVAMAQLPNDVCAGLSLHDLAAAVRPGRENDEVIGALVRLADRGRGSGSGRSKLADDRLRNGREKGRNGGAVSSGSERFDPVARAPVQLPAIHIDEQNEAKPAGSHAPAQLSSASPPAATVETLHGYGSAKQWALDLKQDLALWRNGALPWSQMSTKLLLSGPPGTGKTTFARALCNTLHVPLFANSVSTWLEPSHLGDVIKRMRLSFEEARDQAPAILFVDEIDGIGKRGKENDYNDYWNAVVNKLLELLDGSGKTEGLIIVAATNHPDMIDTALLRSGRLETRIDIPLPDIDALVGILAHHLGNDCPTVIASKPEAVVTDTCGASQNGVGGHASAFRGQPQTKDTPGRTSADERGHSNDDMKQTGRTTKGDF